MDETDEMTDEEITREMQSLTDDEMAQLVINVAVHDAPRTFAVYEVAPDRGDLWAFGWGLSFATRAFFVGCTGEKPTHASMSSADRVVQVFGRNRDLRLVWLPSDAGGAMPWPTDECPQWVIDRFEAELTNRES